MKVVIVGGVAGGATAAARLRRLDEKTEIVILERSGYVSYANCGLPYFIGDVITDKDELTLQTPSSFKKRFNIDVRVNSKVTSIDRIEKKVTVQSLTDGGSYRETYDKLILTPGAKPAWIPIHDVDTKKTFSLRTVEDTFRIKDFIEKNNCKKATIIGGGFIATEMAENLSLYGLDVEIAIRGTQLLPFIDPDMASQIHAYVREKGVAIKARQTPENFSELADAADVVIVAMGVKPETELAEDAGLELGIENAIVTDDFMKTSDPDIYAAGDAVQIRNAVTLEDSLISLAGPANKQGRIIADNIYGLEKRYKGAQTSAVVKVFDMTAAATGVGEKTAKKLELKYDKVITIASSHAAYYPGAEPMIIKTLFERETGKLLGAQIVGFKGVDKRIDVMATAIHGNMTYEDLKELDLAYAPPFGSAKDPVNIVGYVIENVISGTVKQFYYEDINDLINREDVVLLDVRSKREFEKGHFEKACNIPLDTLRDNITKLPKSKSIYVNCYSGLRSYLACRILTNSGFECYNLSGGYGFCESMMKEDKSDLELRYPCGTEIKK